MKFKQKNAAGICQQLTHFRWCASCAIFWADAKARARRWSSSLLVSASTTASAPPLLSSAGCSSAPSPNAVAGASSRERSESGGEDSRRSSSASASRSSAEVAKARSRRSSSTAFAARAVSAFVMLCSSFSVRSSSSSFCMCPPRTKGAQYSMLLCWEEAMQRTSTRSASSSLTRCSAVSRSRSTRARSSRSAESASCEAPQHCISTPKSVYCSRDAPAAPAIPREPPPRRAPPRRLRPIRPPTPSQSDAWVLPQQQALHAARCSHRPPCTSRGVRCRERRREIFGRQQEKRRADTGTLVGEANMPRGIAPLFPPPSASRAARCSCGCRSAGTAQRARCSRCGAKQVCLLAPLPPPRRC